MFDDDLQVYYTTIDRDDNDVYRTTSTFGQEQSDPYWYYM